MEPFWKILAEVEDADLEGVTVREVLTDDSPPVMKYEPSHPDANEDGYVAYPNIRPLEEMANFMAATRSYEANVRAFEAVKELIRRSIELGR
jgi:flagellar basal-body rod protein FlgC